MVISLKITEVRVRKVNGGGKLKAFASITIDGLFVVHDLKVIEGHKGYFVAMPSRKTSNGEFKDIAHPIATEAREMIQRQIIEAYWALEEDVSRVEDASELSPVKEGGTLLREAEGPEGPPPPGRGEEPQAVHGLGEGTPLSQDI